MGEAREIGLSSRVSVAVDGQWQHKTSHKDAIDGSRDQKAIVNDN